MSVVLMLECLRKLRFWCGHHLWHYCDPLADHVVRVTRLMIASNPNQAFAITDGKMEKWKHGEQEN